MEFATYLNQPFAIAERQIDPVTGTVRWLGQERHLRRKELEVLAMLASADGGQVTRQVFIEKLWRGNSAVGEQGLTSTVAALRRSLQDTEAGRPIIRTIPRQGYQLHGQAILLGDSPAAFAVGAGIRGRPGWRLVERLSVGEGLEDWLADDGRGRRRVFRFCCNEAQLRLLRREIKLMRYLREALGGRPDLSVIGDWRLHEPPYFLEFEFTPLDLIQWSLAQGGLSKLSLSTRLTLLEQVAAAVAAVHAVAVVQVDLKPSAIGIESSDGRWQVKLREFGQARLTEPERLQRWKLSNTGIAERAPITAGDGRADAAMVPDPAADVQALGILGVQLALGEWSMAAPLEALEQVQPSHLRELLRRCFSQRADDRPTAQALRDALAAGWSEAPESTPIELRRVTPEASAVHSASPLPGKIAHYRILDLLGDGGMGTVYLAEQRSPMLRKVALKVIKAGMDTAQVLARFEAERQALAMMDHANVAAVFDAGSTDLGQPYFAMEYVPGVDIRAHCDALALSFQQRIELFLQVCDGVMHAHQKGLIHRDLKPGNILVKRAQGQPSMVKIIDFGVAKSLIGKLGQHTAHTRMGSFVGTPVYSSPEQVLGHRMDVDTRADIYSLGVVLYELLAGVTPYRDEELSEQSQAGLVKLLTQSEPPDLATRFSSLDPEDETEIARQRSTTVERMLASLTADLSWIVGKCMERDPDDRYASVLELKKDLERWLEHRPLEARPITGTYRLRKMLRRHRAAVAVAATIAAMLIATAATAIVGYRRAESALEKAELAVEFQVDQMKSIDPAALGLGFRRGLFAAAEARWKDDSQAKSRIEHLNELLDGVDFTRLAIAQVDQAFFEPGLEVIATKYPELPDLQATLWQSSADTLYALGLYEQALDPQALAVKARTEHFGAYSKATLESKAHQGRLLAALDRTQEAAALLDETIEAMHEHTGIDYPAALDALAVRADILQMEGRYQPRKKVLEEVVHRSNRLFGENHPRSLKAQVLLAKAQPTHRVVPLLEQLISKLAAVQGPSHPDTLDAMDDLAWRYYGQRRMGDAIALARDALDRRLAALGEGHPYVISAQARLASLLGQGNQFKEAFPLFRRAIAGSEALFGKRRQRTAIIRGNYGYALWRSGNLVDADRELRFATDTLLAIYGRDTPGESTYGINLALVLRDMGQYSGAKTLFDARISMLKKINGDPALLADAHKDLGQMYLTQGDVESACAENQAGIDALRNIEDADDLRLELDSVLAYCNYRRSGNSRAIADLEAVADGQRKSATADPLDLASSLIRLARMQNEERLWQAAFESAQKADKVVAGVHDQHFLRVPALVEQIRALHALGRADDASKAVESATDIIEKTPGLDPAYAQALSRVRQGD